MTNTAYTCFVQCFVSNDAGPLQVQDAYVQHGSTHDIVSFMQQLGYRDFAAAGPEEAKIEQFKRALKLTRPTSNANKPSKEKVQH